VSPHERPRNLTCILAFVDSRRTKGEKHDTSSATTSTNDNNNFKFTDISKPPRSKNTAVYVTNLP